jgi:hypothetical protein
MSARWRIIDNINGRVVYNDLRDLAHAKRILRGMQAYASSPTRYEIQEYDDD